MDVLTVSSLYHAGGTMVLLRLVYIWAALCLAIGIRWKLGARFPGTTKAAQWLLAAAGLLLVAWLILVEIWVFRGRSPLSLAASAALAITFALGLRSPSRKAFAFSILLAAVGFGYLFPFGTIPKVAMVSEPVVESGRDGQRGDDRLLVQEFADFQCPACAQMDRTVERFAERHEKQVRYVYRHFPLASIHPLAEKAAVASECAAIQGRFGDVKRMLFEQQSQIGSLLTKVDSGSWRVPDPAALRVCIEEMQTFDLVQRDAAEARRLRLRSTPSLLIGEVLVVGTTSLSRLDAILEFAQQQTPRAPAFGLEASNPDCEDKVSPGGCTAPD